MQALRLPTPSVCRPSRTRIVVRAETSVASPINPNIQKENPKVVDTVTTSSVEKQVAYCRCWRSGTFPKCNGAHVAWNKETGDNVGPLLIKKDD
ncbi:g9617 [Coccomyxa elongata]